MPRINYLAPVEAIRYYQIYSPILDNLSRDQLYLILILLLNGEDLNKAFDVATASKDQQ